MYEWMSKIQVSLNLKQKKTLLYIFTEKHINS